MTLTLNQVINRIQVLALSHKQINHFFIGGVDEFLDEFTLKSLNDMIALGYYFKYVAEKKQWIFFSPDGEIIMGFDKKPIKKEMAAKHYSINKKGEITAVFL